MLNIYPYHAYPKVILRLLELLPVARTVALGQWHECDSPTYTCYRLTSHSSTRRGTQGYQGSATEAVEQGCFRPRARQTKARRWQEQTGLARDICWHRASDHGDLCSYRAMVSTAYTPLPVSLTIDRTPASQITMTSSALTRRFLGQSVLKRRRRCTNFNCYQGFVPTTSGLDTLQGRPECLPDLRQVWDCTNSHLDTRCCSEGRRIHNLC